MRDVTDFRQYRWDECEGPPPLIMVIDDDPAGLDLCRIIFTITGFQVVTAHSVYEAWNALQNQMPDVILSDDTMPERSGYDLLEAVSQQPTLSHIPFAIHSSMWLPHSIGSRLHDLPLLDRFISRPFMPHYLLIEMRRLLTLPFTSRTARRDQRILVVANTNGDMIYDALRATLYPNDFVFNVLSLKSAPDLIAAYDPGCVVLHASDADMLHLLRDTDWGAKYPVVVVTDTPLEHCQEFFTVGIKEICNLPLTGLVAAIQNAEYRAFLVKGADA